LTLFPCCTAIIVCAFFDPSACGVAVIVTVLGFGACAGAVYAAVSAVPLPPVDCVVTAFSVPHDAPLHPAPLSDQLIVVFGFEPGTGVNVATTVAEAPVVTLAGAVSCTVKLLVIVRFVAPCFAGSAALCAVTVTLEATGRIAGAV
jgi:hypothetical protein